jgi:cytochrome c oxidase subunit 1
MATAAHPLPHAAAEHAQTGIWSWLTTVDHKRIGILYGVTAFLFFLLGGAEALVMRWQLMAPEMDVATGKTFNGLFTMHATTMIFLVVMPASAAFFNYMVPLMIGARDVAFPRLNAFSYWVFLSGGIFINLFFLTSLFAEGGLGGQIPDAGWFGYANLTSRQYSPGPGVDFWMIGLQILGVGSLAAGFNFIVTILNMRAPGMTMMRLPVFVWMTLVVQFLVVFAFPMITVGLILLTFDRFFGTNFYVPANGGDPLLWQHLFWLFGHPEVYILILPAMGIVSEVLPTFSRKPLFGAPFVIFSGIVIGLLGFGVWSHHMFTTGLGPVADSAFAITTMLIAIPTAVKIFNWIATIWGGQVAMTNPMMFSLGFVALFVIGGLSGFMHASPPIDLHHQDSYFVVAHIHYVLFGGSVFGLFSGFYYWFPKMTGRLMDEGLGRIHFWITFLAMNVTFFPMHFVGVDGMPRRIFTYQAADGWTTWNLVSSLGAFALGLSVLIFIYNWMTSLRRGKVAGNDPWDGATLEWSVPSPPPEHDFDRVPLVTSSRPWWDAKHGASARPGAPAALPAAPGLAGPPIHLPKPTFWPLVAASGIFVFWLGFIAPSSVGLYASLGGVLLLMFGLYSWLYEPLE